MDNLSLSLDLYQKDSSARINWDKSEALQVGHWTDRDRARLPGHLRWGRRGLKVLGVFFRGKNWEGALEKVGTRSSKWTWLRPQLGCS